MYYKYSKNIVGEKIVKSNGLRGWVWFMIECLHLDPTSLQKIVVINAFYFSTFNLSQYNTFWVLRLTFA